MKAVSQSRKQTIYFTMKVALTAFSRIVSLYKVLRAAKRDKAMRESVKEGFKSGGVAFPRAEGKFISEEGPESIVNKRDDFHELNGTFTWNVKFNPDVFKEADKTDALKNNINYLTGNRESDQQFAERLEEAKKGLQPINDFLKASNKPELPEILYMSGQRGGKTLMFKEHLKHCISTDCCGKCKNDKPQ